MLNHKYIAVEVFNIEKDNSSTFPLNLTFKLKDPLSDRLNGPGIYFLYYKTELIYIGYYEKGNGADDVRVQRWIKELATITMRGKQVVFSSAAAQEHQKCKSYPKFKGKISDNGYQTSVNRVAFADANWQDFQNEDFLKDFSFYWFPNEKGTHPTNEELKLTTNQLKTYYKPTCNGKI
jgi:hypothetical protein